MLLLLMMMMMELMVVVVVLVKRVVLVVVVMMMMIRMMMMMCKDKENSVCHHLNTRTHVFTRLLIKQQNLQIFNTIKTNTYDILPTPS
jgi:hypothetical protein